MDMDTLTSLKFYSIIRLIVLHFFFEFMVWDIEYINYDPWDMSLVDIYQYFGWICCLHLHVSSKWGGYVPLKHCYLYEGTLCHILWILRTLRTPDLTFSVLYLHCYKVSLYIRQPLISFALFRKILMQNLCNFVCKMMPIFSSDELGKVCLWVRPWWCVIFQFSQLLPSCLWFDHHVDSVISTHDKYSWWLLI